ncbi:F-box protein At4g22280-like [Trifolium pratense]|uniref:F-box protein At4g22280-like n=1 Tax=Trifolium pratense TaxID=57577 RepID=UPI001E6940C6|nr:F-box protein At4g22280-like [Trifolium pratense]
MSNSAIQNSGVEEIDSKDRLSDLSDCLIIHILSYLDAKQAVQTSVLAPRWMNLWTGFPELTLHSTGFQTCEIFTKFVSRVLCLRDPSIPLQALDFKHARATGRLEPRLLKMIVNYANYSCQTLTHLKLAIYSRGGHQIPFPESLNLPALTSLQLENFKFCGGDKSRAEPFSTFNKLSSLLISNCTISGAIFLCISSVTLVNFTLYNKLSNFYIIELCTPSLCTFAFTGTPYQTLSWSNVSSVKHVEIYAEVIPYQKEPPLTLLKWLRLFPNIKSLTVSTTTLQVLYLIRDLSPYLLKLNLRSLGNLESLKVKMEPFSDGFRMTMCHVMLQKAKSKEEASSLQRAFTEGSEPSSPIPDEIMDLFLRSSPTAKVEFIDC